MKWSLAAQLRLGFGVAFLLALGVAAAAWWVALDYEREITGAYETQLRTTVQLAEAQSAFWQLRFGRTQFMVEGPEGQQRLLEQQGMWYAIIDERLAAYDKAASSADERRTLTNLRSLYQRYKQALPKFFELWQAGEKDEATAWLALTLGPFGTQVGRAFDAQIALQRSFVEQDRERSERGARLGLAVVAAITIGLLGMLVIGYVAAMRMLRPIRALRVQAQAIVREQLGETVAVSASSNEVTALVESFQLMSGRVLAHADALRRSNERLDFLMSATPAVIWNSEARGSFRVIFISANVRTELGYDPDEFAGTGFWADHIHPDDRERVLAGLAVIERQDSHAHEYRFRHKDGSWRWMHDDLRVIRDASGAPLELVGYWIDVTDRHRAEEAMRESENRLRQLVRSTPAVIWSCRAEGDYARTFVSENVREILGYAPEEFVADPRFWVSHIHSEDRPAVLGQLPREIEANEFAHEYRFRHADGTWRWIRADAAVVRDAAGRPEQLVGYWIDITERVLAEKERERIRERLQSALGSGGFAVWDADTGTDKVWLSEQWAQLLGGPPRETWTTAREMLALVHPDDRSGIREAVVEVMKGRRKEYAVEHRVRTVTGEWRWILFQGRVAERAADGRAARLSGVTLDITERKKADAIRARLAAVVQFSNDAIISKTLDGIIQSWNEGATRLFGYSAPEAIGQSISLLIPPGQEDEEPAIIARLKRGETTSHYETRRRRKDGTLLEVSLTVSPIKDETGRIVGASTIIRDITERNAAEAALRASEERFRSTFDLAAVGIAHIGPDRRFLRVNQRLCEILGYSEAELVGLTGRQISHPDDLDVINEQRPRLYAGEIDSISIEKRYLRKDGSTVWVAFAMALQRDAAGEPQHEITIYDDITERKRAQAAVAEALRAKSEFMNNVTHELRTPLNSVIGFAEMLKDEVPGPLNPKQAAFAADILAAGQQLLRLVEGILEMSRLDAADVAIARQPMDVGAALEERVAAHRQACAAHGVTIGLDVRPGAGRAELNPQALRRMLDALLDNAIKFNRDGGTVALRARREDDCLEIAVVDTGIGIAREDFAKLFKPLVQLDAGLARRHSGVGLGLALARRLAELHGGTIEVESEPGKGSTFTLRLPLQEAS